MDAVIFMYDLLKIAVTFFTKYINQSGAAFLGYDRKNNENLVIDHLNGIKHDNRLENLEVVSRSENSKRFWNSTKGKETRQKMRKPHSKKVKEENEK